MFKECKRGHKATPYINPKGVAECKPCRAEDQKRWREHNKEKSRFERKTYMKKLRSSKPGLVKEWQHKARAKKAGVEIGCVDIQKLFDDFDGICALCRREVIGVPHIDHIYPISRGGKHEQSNLQLVHKSCNSIKCNKVYSHA